MSTAQHKHREAMRVAASADRMKADGDLAAAHAAYLQAFALEREAALEVWESESNALTKGVLIRSAATLGYLAGEFREAEKLVGLGLSGDVPISIAEELRDLYENITLGRHLDLKGISLSRSEFRLAIHGNAVGHGIAPSDEVNHRLELAELLAYRTAERIQGLPFHESGLTHSEIKRLINPHQYVPHAASYAIVFRLGEQSSGQDSSQAALAERTIQNIYAGLSAISDGSPAKLEDLIPDPNYRRNFVHLAHALAPDGDRVKLIGISVATDGELKHLSFQRTKVAVAESFFQAVMPGPIGPIPEFHTAAGSLALADGGTDHSGRIQVSGNGDSWVLHVPSGLGDLVRLNLGDWVKAIFHVQDGNFVLDSLARTEYS